MRLGLKQRTHLSPEQVIDIIHGEAKRMGYTVEVFGKTQDVTRFKTQFKSLPGCFKALLRRLPTEVYWEVRSQDEETCIYSDAKTTGVYLWVLLSALGLFAFCYLKGFNALMVDWAAVSTLELSLDGILLLVSLVLGFVNYSLLQGGALDRLMPIAGRLRMESIAAGSSLSEFGHGISIRNLFRNIFYLVFTAGVLLAPVVRMLLKDEALESYSPSVLIFIGVLVSLVLLLVLTLPLMLRHPGFGVRLIPALPGIWTTIAVLLLLCAQFPFVIMEGTFGRDDVRFMKAAQDFINDAPGAEHPTYPNGTPVKRQEVMDAFGKMRFWAWASWLGALFLLTMALWSIMQAFKCVLQAYPYLFQLVKRPDCLWSQQAVQGRGFFRRFQLLYVVAWGLLATCLVFAGLRIATTTSYFFIKHDPNIQSSTLNAMESSVLDASLALNIPLDAPLLGWAVLTFWVGYLSICWLVIGSSIASYVVQRFLLFSRSRHGDDPASGRIPKMKDSLARMWRKHSKTATPELAINISTFPAARAKRAGFFSNRTTIEMTMGCFNLLTDDELEAVLAHELGHCAAGHCLIDDIIRFAGRCTFVGDGFARMLQDTFGYEEVADRYAVEVFGISPEELVRALWKFDNIRAIEQLRWSSPAMSSADAADESETSTAFDYLHFTFLERLNLGLKLYVSQYLGVKYSGYWHPSVAHRTSHLDRKSDRDAEHDTSQVGGTVDDPTLPVN